MSSYGTPRPFKPLCLRRGDLVVVCAPSSPPDQERLVRGIAILEGWGLRVSVLPSARAAGDYLAGPDEDRQGDLRLALRDRETGAVMAARGGYGVARLLTGLHFPRRTYPPLLVGFSDISLLLLAACQRAGWAGLHGPNVCTLARLDAEALELARGWLFGREQVEYDGLVAVRRGVARGTVVPANLSVLASVLGTPLAPNLYGAILILEEVGERAYRVDRLLSQVVASKSGRGVAGLILGDLDRALESAELNRTVHDVARQLGIPVCTGFPIGHGPRARPVPVGLKATLDAGRGTLVFEETLFASRALPYPGRCPGLCDGGPPDRE